MQNHCSYYLETLFTPSTFEKAVKQLSEWVKQDKIDAVAGQGTSGVVMASAVALSTGCKLIVVRKQTEDSHGVYGVEFKGLTKASKIAIVDDLVATGRTIEHICKGLAIDKLKATHLYLYHDDGDVRPKVKNLGLTVRATIFQ